VQGGVEARLARLEAIEAIRELKARYADVCDTGYDPVRMRPVFTEDAVWDGGPRFGRYDVADDGRTATGSWYLLEPCTIATKAGPRAMLITGRYADRYRLESDGWKFSEVVLDCQTLSPLDEGWVRTRFWSE
jgi:hypothetical protein